MLPEEQRLETFDSTVVLNRRVPGSALIALISQNQAQNIHRVLTVSMMPQWATCSPRKAPAMTAACTHVMCAATGLHTNSACRHTWLSPALVLRISGSSAHHAMPSPHQQTAHPLTRQQRRQRSCVQPLRRNWASTWKNLGSQCLLRCWQTWLVPLLTSYPTVRSRWVGPWVGAEGGTLGVMDGGKTLPPSSAACGGCKCCLFAAVHTDIGQPETDDLEALREFLGVAADPLLDDETATDDAPDNESRSELQRLLAHLHDPVLPGSQYTVLQVRSTARSCVTKLQQQCCTCPVVGKINCLVVGRTSCCAPKQHLNCTLSCSRPQACPLPAVWLCACRWPSSCWHTSGPIASLILPLIGSARSTTPLALRQQTTSTHAVTG